MASVSWTTTACSSSPACRPSCCCFFFLSFSLSPACVFIYHLTPFLLSISPKSHFFQRKVPSLPSLDMKDKCWFKMPSGGGHVVVGRVKQVVGRRVKKDQTNSIYLSLSLLRLSPQLAFFSFFLPLYLCSYDSFFLSLILFMSD